MSAFEAAPRQCTIRDRGELMFETVPRKGQASFVFAWHSLVAPGSLEGDLLAILEGSSRLTALLRPRESGGYTFLRSVSYVQSERSPPTIVQTELVETFCNTTYWEYGGWRGLEGPGMQDLEIW